jgi:hypothetical protein
MPPRVTLSGIGPRRWVSYAACAWAVLFAAPHVWWALGVPAGFPGGDESYELFMGSAWRFAFDVLVVLLSVLMVLITRALMRSEIPVRLRRILVTLAWLGSGLLTLRGVAGGIVDGASDPVWWPTFLTGGILLGAVARSGGKRLALS